MPYTPTQQLTVDVLAWPGTSVRLGSRGEYGFDAHGHELGHLHGDRVAHFGFDRRLGTELHEAGRVGPHPVAPQSLKMGARSIESEADVDDIRAILRLNYERPARLLVGKIEAALGDVDALADLLTEHAVVVSEKGIVVEGRETFRAVVKAARAGGAPVPEATLTFDSAEFPSADLIVASATRTVAEGPAAVTAKLTLTLVPEGKRWLIAAMQTTTVSATPAPTAQAGIPFAVPA